MTKDFSNGKIYMLQPTCDHEEGDIYIGSTIRPLLCKRMADHRKDYRNWKKEKHHYMSSFFIFEKYGLENCKIILIESFPCNNNEELRAREAHHQKTLKCVNKQLAFTTKEEKLEYFKKYNKNRIEEMKQYREEHRDEILQYNKKYREEHHNEILEKNKKYYQNNKKQILEKISCECGREINKYHLKRHQTSNIHKELMLQLTKEK